MRSIIMTVMLSATAAIAGPTVPAEPAFRFAKELIWEETKDKTIEFPRPENFSITFGMAGFEDSLVLLGRNDASFSIVMIDGLAGQKSLPEAVANQEKTLKRPGLNCSKGQPGQGTLRNGWPAAWTQFECRSMDGSKSKASLVVFRAANKLFLLSGTKVPLAWSKTLAGHGRVKVWGR